MAKKYLQAAAFMCCLMVGCERTPVITRSDVIGEYVYHDDDFKAPAPGHEFDHLTLRAGGMYELTQWGLTVPKTQTTGVWTLWAGKGNGPRVLFGNSSYQPEIVKGEFRLRINRDEGLWYSKVKSN